VSTPLNDRQPTPEPEDVVIADDRIDKYVTEADDIYTRKLPWNLTLTDGEQMVLVQTAAQLEAWCDSYGITVGDFIRDFPIAKKMPNPLKAELALN
jgi:hypothetical protein